MLVYFVKATYTDGIYKISDFYVGNSYKTPAATSLDIQLEASDGIVITKPTTGILPDNTTIRDYTHMLVPSQKKIYKIIGYEYVNISQTRMTLREDPLLSNCIELHSKNIMLSRTNDASKFIGMNDVRDLAIRHKAEVVATSSPSNDTGAWVMITFQDDISTVEFVTQTITLDRVPTVPERTFSSLVELQTKYPEGTVNDPWTKDYYLKFAGVGNDIYQAVKVSNSISWKKIKTDPTYTKSWHQVNIDEYITTHMNKGYLTSPKNIVSPGDINSCSIILPLDATVAFAFDYQGTDRYIRIPTYYEIASFTEVDKISSIKIIPSALIDQQTINVQNSGIITELQYTSTGIYSYTETVSSYTLKVFQSSFVDLKYIMERISNPPSQSNPVAPTLPILNIFSFKSEFEFNYNLIDVFDYEPFKKYFLYFFGEVIELPARYLDSFKIRLAVTSTDVIYEVYTETYNVIGSGRLQWFTRYTLDQLALFEANNPTYKEQFWTNQLSGAIKSIGVGAVGGAVKGGPIGATAGAAAGLANSAISTTIASVNMHWMEKGLRDKADQIFGQNDISMTIIKGLSASIIAVTPETDALNQMKTNYNMTGFPTNTLAKINALSYEINTIFGTAKIVAGQLLEIVKNQNATDEINKILQQGIILIP